MRYVLAFMFLWPVVAFGAALEKYGASGSYRETPVPAEEKATFAQIRREADAAIAKFRTLPPDEQRRIATELARKSKEAEQAGNPEAWLYYRMVIDGIGGVK